MKCFLMRPRRRRNINEMCYYSQVSLSTMCLSSTYPGLSAVSDITWDLMVPTFLSLSCNLHKSGDFGLFSSSLLLNAQNLG